MSDNNIYLTKAQILGHANKPRRVVPFDVPAWATDDNPTGRVYLRKLKAREYSAYIERHEKAPDSVQHSMLAALTLCDPSGTPLFDDNDEFALAELDFEGVFAVWKKAQQLHGVLSDSAKNSAPTRDDDSSPD